jgi:hypothetical protein
MIDADFIKKVEAEHFRTDQDTGANSCALFIWNLVRAHAGLPTLKKSDLRAYCETHGKYHVIMEDYGCIRRP